MFRLQLACRARWTRSVNSEVTWGNGVEGGDSTALQDRPCVLRSWNVQQRQFPTSKDKLRDVQQIEASSGAFLAIRADGSVVTWGNSDAR